MQSEQLEARRDALCRIAHAWLECGGESDEHYTVTYERCVHCNAQRTIELPRMPGPLTALDRADMRRELEESAEHYECMAVACEGLRGNGSVAAASWRARALRLRQLVALLATLCLLVLAGCADEQPPPPYEVHFDVSVPAADREVWGKAASDWNAAIGEPQFLVGSTPANGRCGVEVVLVERRAANSPAENWAGSCLMRIEYARGRLKPCVALHETGHKLLGVEHVPGTVMDANGCDYAAEVTPELAELVRSTWGMP